MDTLEELAQEVEEQADSAEPLDLITAAMGTKADLDDLGDGLIDIFVGRARAAGCSWSEIGGAMGVTKQAAQQRHTSDRRPRSDRPFRIGRFTGRARTAVREAQAEAGDLRHAALDTEHLLLGVLAVPRCLAAEALASFGVTRDAVLAALGETEGGRPDRGRRRRIPFTPHAKKALELSLSNASHLGHNYIGPEHILLALFDVADGKAVQILTEAGVTKAATESFVVDRLRAAS
jgi:hypothetical protein